MLFLGVAPTLGEFPLERAQHKAKHTFRDVALYSGYIYKAKYTKNTNYLTILKNINFLLLKKVSYFKINPQCSFEKKERETIQPVQNSHFIFFKKYVLF